MINVYINFVCWISLNGQCVVAEGLIRSVQEVTVSDTLKDMSKEEYLKRYRFAGFAVLSVTKRWGQRCI